MAATSNPSLSSLLSRSSLDDHEQFLAASEAALKVSKTDAQAQHVKVIALLKLDRFQDALSYFEATGQGLKEKAALEYAYTLYKAGRLEDAAQVASKLSTERGAKHVEAQATYRLEDYSRTAQLYKDLRKEQVPVEEYDLKVNQGAIDAQGQWLGLLEGSSARRPDRDDLSAFETAYNAACGSIARGELSQAEVLLKRAKTLCQHSEELTDEQKKEELLPILVQQAYVLHCQGKTAEAEATSNEISVDEIVDASTKTIAASNRLLTSSLQANPFLVHKTFHNTPKIPESDKLFSYQSVPLSSNEKTVNLNSFKSGGLSKSTKQKSSTTSQPSTSSENLLSSAFAAASLAKNDVGRVAINKVLSEVKKCPTDIGLIMTIVQLYILIGDTTSAIETAESLVNQLENSTDDQLEVRYHPGLVSVVTALYKRQGRREHVKRELAKAASYWRQKSKPPITLLRAAGISLLESSTAEDAQIASEIFDKLYSEQPEDKATIAGYVASHAVSDPDSVKGLAGKLKPVSELVANINVDELESAGIPQASNALAIAQAGISRKRAVPTGAEVGSKKRIRKSRLPKDYDANAGTKPDPERWLPMRDRSYYRPPKGKKKGRKGDDRTQGGAVSEELDVSKQPQKGGEVVGGGGGGGGAKKKKGKGKK